MRREKILRVLFSSKAAKEYAFVYYNRYSLLVFSHRTSQCISRSLSKKGEICKLFAKLIASGSQIMCKEGNMCDYISNIYLVVAISWLHVTVPADFGGKWVKYTHYEHAEPAE